MKTNWLKSLLDSTHIIVFGFGLIILLGGLVLMLPISSATGQWTNFIDAIFTATTSVCVTGLVVVPTFSYWSIFGKLVIMLLIQLGGLGVICVTMGLFIVIRRKITLNQRKIISESYNLDKSGGMVRLIKRVFQATITIEGIGALLYAIRFVPQYGLIRGIWYSVFHSVSAFCNAGIDIIGSSSFVPYYDDWLINLTTMFLIISGGIGFVVWWDIVVIIKDVKLNKLAPNKMIERLPVHSKLAIVVTAILIVSGTVLILAFEYNNASTISEMKMTDKVMVSLFESVTLRTAGFATVSQSGFRDATVFVLCGLMFIGGSPMGTAGGIKTTTIAILFIEIISVIRGRKNAEIFKRRIAAENVRTAISVVMISFLCVTIAIMALSFTENTSIKVLAFEAFSAIGTVGLTMDYTPLLSNMGKVIIIMLMYLGRIGPITMVMAFAMKRSGTLENEYPVKRIVIG